MQPMILGKRTAIAPPCSLLPWVGGMTHPQVVGSVQNLTPLACCGPSKATRAADSELQLLMLGQLQATEHFHSWDSSVTQQNISCKHTSTSLHTSMSLTLPL